MISGFRWGSSGGPPRKELFYIKVMAISHGILYLFLTYDALIDTTLTDIPMIIITHTHVLCMGLYTLLWCWNNKT